MFEEIKRADTCAACSAVSPATSPSAWKILPIPCPPPPRYRQDDSEASPPGVPSSSFDSPSFDASPWIIDYLTEVACVPAVTDNIVGVINSIFPQSTAPCLRFHEPEVLHNRAKIARTILEFTRIPLPNNFAVQQVETVL